MRKQLIQHLLTSLIERIIAAIYGFIFPWKTAKAARR